jgi:hypothetical protein
MVSIAKVRKAIGVNDNYDPAEKKPRAFTTKKVVLGAKCRLSKISSRS